MTPPDKLTVEECERGIEICTTNGRWDEAKILHQLLGTMRDVEQLREAIKKAMDAPMYVGSLDILHTALHSCSKQSSKDNGNG